LHGGEHRTKPGEEADESSGHGIGDSFTGREGTAGADEPRPYEEPQLSRILGEPRHYKGYAKVFACDAGGVAELMLQKRDAPELFKALKQGTAPTLHRWTHLDGRITQIQTP